jgi:hypothetical protein
MATFSAVRSSNRSARLADQVGGQRTISRFAVTPAGEDRWLGSAARHWNLGVRGAR